MIFAFFLALYLAVGLLFGLYFLVSGYQSLLADARGTKLHIRFVWLPAAMAIWPILIIKLFSKPTRP